MPPGCVLESLADQPSSPTEHGRRLQDWLSRLKDDGGCEGEAAVDETDSSSTTQTGEKSNEQEHGQSETRLSTPADGSSRSKRPGEFRRAPYSVGIGIPRAATFKRTEDEQRKNLEPVLDGEAGAATAADDEGIHRTESSHHSSTKPRQRPRAVSALPASSTASLWTKDLQRKTSLHDLAHTQVPPNFLTNGSSAGSRELAGDGTRPGEHGLLSPPPSPGRERLAEGNEDTAPAVDGQSDTSSQCSEDAAFDAEIQAELKSRWILNVSMHFRDKSRREKFFVSFAQTPQKSRRVTISLDYRHAEPDSLEAELGRMTGQREKNARIYESLRDSLDDISFFDTVTNLKLQTENARLHVHVTEDVNEVIHYPPVRQVEHITHIQRYCESELQFVEHLSGYVYKVNAGGQLWAKKEIPGPESVDEFLYEMNALADLVDATDVIRLHGLVLSDDGATIRGLLIAFAEEGSLLDVLYNAVEDCVPIPWPRTERWAAQIVRGLRDIHDMGYVHGDFTLANIVIDDRDDGAKLIDMNRRGCPVGWEPPELARLVTSGQRLSMLIGVKSDLFQLGMVLWALATQNEEPERQTRPLSLSDIPSDVPEYFKEIISICLSSNPRHRSSAAELLHKFPPHVRHSQSLEQEHWHVHADMSAIHVGDETNTLASHLSDASSTLLSLSHPNSGRDHPSLAKDTLYNSISRSRSPSKPKRLHSPDEEARYTTGGSLLEIPSSGSARAGRNTSMGYNTQPSSTAYSRPEDPATLNLASSAAPRAKRACSGSRSPVRTFEMALDLRDGVAVHDDDEIDIQKALHSARHLNSPPAAGAVGEIPLPSPDLLKRHFDTSRRTFAFDPRQPQLARAQGEHLERAGGEEGGQSEDMSDEEKEEDGALVARIITISPPLPADSAFASPTSGVSSPTSPTSPASLDDARGSSMGAVLDDASAGLVGKGKGMREGGYSPERPGACFS